MSSCLIPGGHAKAFLANTMVGAPSSKRQLHAGAFDAERQLCTSAFYASGAGALYAKGQACLFACRNWLIVTEANTAIQTD